MRITNITLLMVTALTLSLILCGCGAEKVSEASAPEVAQLEVAQPEAATEATEPVEEESEMNAPTLTFCGHAGIKIKSKDGHVLYIDPYFYQGDYSEKADIVLVTHGHDDHKPAPNVKLNDGGLLITWKEAHPDPDTYESGEYFGFQIEAVPAENSNHDIRYCVGYIVTVDGISIYHAGDTSMTPSMADLAAKSLDYACYPIDGTFNMDAAEATEVANLVGAKHNIPIHDFDKEGEPKKSENFNPEGKLVLELNETIALEK